MSGQPLVRSFQHSYGSFMANSGKVLKELLE
jgi:hypothetical protein